MITHILALFSIFAVAYGSPYGPWGSGHWLGGKNDHSTHSGSLDPEFQIVSLGDTCHWNGGPHCKRELQCVQSICVSVIKSNAKESSCADSTKSICGLGLACVKGSCVPIQCHDSTLVPFNGLCQHLPTMNQKCGFDSISNICANDTLACDSNICFPKWH